MKNADGEKDVFLPPKQGPKLTFYYGRQLAIKYKFLVARGQIVVAKNFPSLFFQ